MSGRLRLNGKKNNTNFYQKKSLLEAINENNKQF